MLGGGGSCLEEANAEYRTQEGTKREWNSARTIAGPTRFTLSGPATGARV